jgi:C4-dicarboxylate-specific signal transduction histidine kinase
MADIGSFEYDINSKELSMSKNLKKICDIDTPSLEYIYTKIHISDKRNIKNSLQNMIENNLEHFEDKFRIKVKRADRVLYIKATKLKEKNQIEAIIKDITDIENTKNELLEHKNFIDIKVEKNIESLRKKDDIMLAQSRLASHGELISMLAHQWRQPLSSISTTLANIQLQIQLNIFDKKEVESEIESINESMKKLNEKIDEFRLFFQPIENKTTIRVDNIIKNSVSLLEQTLNENKIDVKLELNCDIKMTTYPNKITQIVLNIIKNSIEQLLESKVKTPYISIKCNIEDNKILFIRVADNGGGISDEIIFNIFDPYFSTKGKNGVGLGLFISQTIANKYLDGDIKAYNNKDGAVFLIELPITE